MSVGILRFGWLAVLVGGMAVFAFGGDSAAATEPDSQRTAHQIHPFHQEASDEQQLVDRYSPIMRMEPPSSTCDENVSFGPTGIETTFGLPDLTLENSETADVLTAPKPADIAGKGATYYLDLPGDPRDPGCALGDLMKQSGPPKVTYSRVVTEPGQEGTVVQYWFYYVLNDWNNDHESDWEFMQIRFEASTAAEALTKAPVETVFSQHGGGELADWDGDKLERDGDHPIVHVSQGSNANYYEARVYLGKGEPGTGFGCDDASGHNLEFAPEVRLVPDDYANDPEWSWFGFEGRWGELLPGENGGPTGPPTKPYFHEPLSWQSAQRDSSVSFLGDSPPILFFCDMAAIGGNILNSFQTNPLAVASVVFLVVGVVAVSSTVTIRVSRKPLPFNTGDPSKWEREWRFGELVRGGFSIYRQHPLVFAGIAIPALLLGSFLGSIQAWVFSLPPLEGIVELADSRGFSGALVLAYGYGIALPMVLLCTSTVLSAMVLMRDQRPITIPGAYAMVWDNLGDLFIARLRAVVVVTLLIISIVGVPFAIQRLIRWYFLEQAILFEGDGRRAARETSERAVNGRWGHAAGRIALISAYGGLPGPIFAFVLIMLTDLPLEVISVLGGAVTMLLLPWAGFALGLLYHDLKVRAANASGERSLSSTDPASA